MAEWTHPRRPAKETISYLTQIEPVLDQFDEGDAQQLHRDDDDNDSDDVGREQMLDNVLEEIKHQTASIMEDRKGSVVAEKIAKRLTPLQLRVVLSRCRGYMLSLANNRYSSHVLQTLLSLSGPVIEAELSVTAGDDLEVIGGTQGDAGADPKADLLHDIVLSLVSELTGTWGELMADISGSHAGRGFLQVLGGLPILSEQRGKQSRHSHSIGTAVGPASRAVAGNATGLPVVTAAARPAVDPDALDKWSTPHKYRVPASFSAALAEATMELAALPTAELQSKLCGTFGCPLVVMLLRVYGNMTVEANSGQLPCLAGDSPAMVLVAKALEWEDEDRIAEVVYAMSGENTASHFLEAVLWLSPSAFFKELYQRCFDNRLLEFCEHGVSNFLVQAALQRVDDKQLADGMVDAISGHTPALLAGGRAGVLWRAAQACVRLSLKTKTQSKLVDAIGRAAWEGHAAQRSSPPPGGEEGPGDAAGGGVAPTPSTQSSDPFTAARVWVPALLGARLPGEGGLNRLFLNVPGARIVQNILRFAPVVAAPVLKAVATLPEALLAAIARDNLGSRCLMDPILEAAGGKDGGNGKNKPAEDARRTVLRAFRGHLVAMACDRVAWHVLLKLFKGLDTKDKRAIAEELAGGGEQEWLRMSGYPSGRSVMTECMVERFARSPHEWEEAFNNRDNRAKMLEEIFAIQAKSGLKCNSGQDKTTGIDSAFASSSRIKNGSVAPSPFNQAQTAAGNEKAENRDGTVAGVENGEGGQSAGKEKRRRQRGRGKRGKGSGKWGMPDGEEEGGPGGDVGTADLGEAGAPGRAGAAKASQEDAPSEDKGDQDDRKPDKSKKVKMLKKTGSEDVAAAGDKAGGAVVVESLAGTKSEAKERSLKVSKKKRKRPDEEYEGGARWGAAEASVGTPSGADLSFVMEAIAASVEGPDRTGGKRANKGGKKRKCEETMEGGGKNEDDGQRASQKTSKRRREGDDEAGGEVERRVDDPDGGWQKKKSDRSEKGSGERNYVAARPKESKESDLSKNKTGSSKEKKKKKKTAGGGFRMF